MSEQGGLVAVRILGMSMKVYQASSEHSDELIREFALIAGGDSTDHVPARLLALIDTLNARFGAFAAAPTSAIDAARQRGDVEIDLVYQVPPEAGPACAELTALLDQADDFCRSGDLLTLATPHEAVVFRHWFLDEFVRQTAGLPPRPWSTVVGQVPQEG